MLAFEIHYLSSTHDERYISLLDSIFADVEALASSRAGLHPFRYVNYASKGQDVWAVLREKGEMEEVRDVQEIYDPDGTWERRLSGGFKIK